MRFYSGKSAVTSPAYTHMDSFSAGQCPWAVTGEGGQILRAAVAVRAAYTAVKSQVKHTIFRQKIYKPFATKYTRLMRDGFAVREAV